MNNILSYILWLLVAVALQVLLFNHLPLFGGVAFVYVVALFKAPLNIGRIAQIIMGFVVGLFIDIFCNTHGMHALTTVTMMFFREPIFNLHIANTDHKNIDVNISRLGMHNYMRYALTIVTMHVLMLYTVEAFTLFNFVALLLKAIISISLTWGFAMIWEFATLKK